MSDAHDTFIMSGIDPRNIVGHLISLGAIFGWFADALPAIATLAALVWYAVQIYESDTFQRHVLRRRRKIDDLPDME